MDNPKLLYLSILLIVLLSSYLIAMRDNLPKLIKSASAWVIIFSCFVAGYGLWQDLSNRETKISKNNASEACDLLTIVKSCIILNLQN